MNTKEKNEDYVVTGKTVGFKGDQKYQFIE